MIIRTVEKKDLDAVMAIMNYYRANTNHIWDREPLNAAAMERWYGEHTAFPYTAVVCEEDGAVTGYASLSKFRPHAGYAKTAENSVYIAPGRDKGGRGRALMEELFKRARENGLKVITAWIDSDNKASVYFHERLGFRYCGRLDNVGVLDRKPVSVIIMQYDL